MNKFAQYPLIVFLMIIVARPEAQAVTRMAPSCSDSAIQSAINSASDGDTVSVPTGNCTWNGQVSIPSTKGIALQGSGSIDSNGNYSSSGTYINLGANSLIVRTKPSGNSPIRITGFHFTHSDPSSATGAIIIQGQSGAYYNGSTNWRVDHNYFYYNGPVGANPGVHIQGWTWGLIDHNVLYHQGRAFFVEMGSNNFEPGSNQFYGDGSWNTNLGGPIDWGGPKAVYIEDNWAYGDQRDNSNQFIDSHWGARIVMRYNRIQDMQIQSHSGCSNHGRSTMHQEIYNNTFVSDGAAAVKVYSALFIRGGTFVFYNNTITGTYASHPNSYIIDYQHGTDGCNACGAPTPYVNGVCTWPCVDQIGTGPDASHSGRASSPAYAWNNFQNGNPINITKGQCGVNNILERRDYYNNTAKPGYSPYTYPHPLTIGGLEPPRNLRGTP